MCKRNCIYMTTVGDKVATCSYHRITGTTRTATLCKKYHLKSPTKELKKRLMGECCELYRWNGEGKPIPTKPVSQAPEPKKKPKEKHKWVPKADYQPAPEADLMALYKEGLNDCAMAERLGISVHSVNNWRHVRGLGSNYIAKRRFNEELAMRLYDEGFSDIDIGKKVGVGNDAIGRWRQKNGLRPNGQNHGTLEQRELRKKLYFEGFSDREIAKRCGKSAAWVSNWRCEMRLPRNCEPHTGRKKGGKE